MVHDVVDDVYLVHDRARDLEALPAAGNGVEERPAGDVDGEPRDHGGCGGRRAYDDWVPGQLREGGP